MPPHDMMIEGRPVGQVLAWSRDLVDPALHAAVDTLPSAMRDIAGYHLGWCDEHGTPISGHGGKGIRPALVLLTAQAAGGSADAAVPAAVAVSLVHDFSLIHDDVIDGDHTRRHRPTAWSLFGEGSAILAGDALLTLAFDVLAASRHPDARNGARMLSAAVLGMIEGQSIDLAFERRTDVDLPACLDMAAKKTGALIACACVLGAAFGEGNGEQLDELRAFGEHLGLAFQHVDDLLGIWGDPEVTGKPIHSDLRNRKKSLPVVAALHSGTPAGRELTELYQRDEPLSDTDIVLAAELVDVAGGRTWSAWQVERLLAQALRHLRAARPEPGAAGELEGLAQLIVRRDR